MHRIVLEVCAGIAGLLCLASLAAMVVHHARRRREGVKHGVPVAEYLWAVVPWVMVAAAAFPAVWPILGPQSETRTEEVPRVDRATTAATEMFPPKDHRPVIDSEAR